CEAGAYGSLGVVFVGLRIAEIDEHPITHVARDEASGFCNQSGDAPVVGRDHLAQIFRIEASTQSRRADQVGEHHRELAPLSQRSSRRPRRRFGPIGSSRDRGSTAIAAEPFVSRVLAAAGTAAPGQGGSAIPTKFGAGPDVCTASRAIHAFSLLGTT